MEREVAAPGWGGIQRLLRLAFWRCAISVVGQAINIRRQQMHLVIPLQHILRRHLALAAVTDGLLQLRQAGAVDKAAGLPSGALEANGG